MRHIKSTVATLLVAILAFAQMPVLASNAESIESFEIVIDIDADASAEVAERISYDFAGNERRGVFRDIPVRYDSEDEARTFYEINLDVLDVRRESSEVVHDVDAQENYTRVSMGDIDSTPIERGVELYELDYRLSPVAYQREGRDIVQIDLLGDRWDVSVGSLSAIVNLPAEPIDATCFMDESRDFSPECIVSSSNNSLVFVAGNIDANSGVTAYIEFPEGTFNNYLEPQERPFPWMMAIGILFGGVLMLGAIGGLAWSHISYRLRRRKELVIAQYDPPEGMTPADIGLLNNNTTNEVEFSATIIDLASRGHLDIEYRQERSFFRTKQKYTFHKKKPEGEYSLRDYEWEILNALFSNGDSVDLEDVDKQRMQKTMKSMHEKIKKRLVSKGYYEELPKWAKSLKNATWITVVMVIAYFIYPLSVIAIGLLVVGFASWKGMLTLASRKTSKGYAGWAHIEGFKEFLMMTEAERMDFHEAPERTPEEFSKFLPYAIALGVEDKWTKQFESMTLPQQSWVSGAYAGAAINSSFISGLSGGLNSYAKSSYSSGGGFSGGGGVGGGVGGGGGGSF